MGFKKIGLAAAAAALGMSSAAQAVPAASDSDGTALILRPLTLTKISDLDFGDVIPSSVSGVVTIDPTSGERSFAGGVIGGSGDTGNRAHFGGGGSANQQVIVVIDHPTRLEGPGDAFVTVLGMTLDGPSTRSVDPDSRAFFVGVGGTLLIAADQAEGAYTADFTVTAHYQ